MIEEIQESFLQDEDLELDEWDWTQRNVEGSVDRMPYRVA